MDDVRFEKFPRLRASVAPSGAYVRCTTRTTAVSADGQRACVAPIGANRQGGADESIWEVPALAREGGEERLLP